MISYPVDLEKKTSLQSNKKHEKEMLYTHKQAIKGNEIIEGAFRPLCWIVHARNVHCIGEMTPVAIGPSAIKSEACTFPRQTKQKMVNHKFITINVIYSRIKDVLLGLPLK